ncbi:MAG: cache domain-containing protein [Proteobacteria bacterium]|nr:cache domain-containing protein [Pseudomonadota bacterium]MBU2453193.1 cache domain-containing protein [Pseudomonadota bacterium]
MFVFIPLILIGSSIAYYQVKKILQTSIEKELQDTTDSLVNLIKTTASVSIKNRLHAIAEKNLDIAQYYYKKYQSGLISRTQAIETIEEIFLSQPVGISGYIYCLNSIGIVTVHPNDKVKDSDVSEFDFVRQQMKMKDGYLEYDWKNPGEAQKRPKALYMVYFKQFDWIISVSSYREEFNHLVNIDDFRESILSHKTGKTGYAYVLDEKGTVIVHPNIQGTNLFEQSENPNESTPREKIVIFRYLPEYKWIVASSSYVEEVFSPLKTFRNFLFVALIIVLLFSIGITYLISTFVTKPLAVLMDKLEEGSRGDFSVRMAYADPDEFGKLSQHFNSFMDQLEGNHEKIEKEIQKNIEAQTALVENDLKLRGLFNQSFQYTGILSPSGILEEVNQSGLDFAGCTAGDVVYKPFWQAPWWRHDPKVQQQLKQAVQRAVQGNLVRYETTSISKDEEIRDIDISIKPVFNPFDEVVFIITEGRDITEYKLAAQERKNLAVQLEKSQKMEAIGTLAGGIAHDFNNILSGILGYAHLAELNLNTPIKAKGHIAQIVKGAQRAAELTQQILTFSRQTEYEKHPMNLYLVVKEALKLLRSSIPATIEIRENIVSKEKVLADPTQMHQVIMNLCTNAYHAMGETGGILTVQLDAIETSENKDLFDFPLNSGRYLKLEITDTGMGMDKETLSKAFDPYFTTKEIGKGTGFGLALVHAIVQEHDGFINVISSKGQGASFYVYLPVAQEGSTLYSDSKKEKSFKGGTEKIMVVDDEEDIRLIIQEFLTSCGYSVTTFENGAKAFEAFEKAPNHFDLVVTDMTMPKMTGDELSSRVLNLRKDMPIILCTGYSEAVSEARALELGIRKFVQKPIAYDSLAALIRDLLDQGVSS